MVWDTKYSKINQRQKNAIEARIEGIVKKYGFDNFRIVAQRRIKIDASKRKLEEEILQKEQELTALKRKKK